MRRGRIAALTAPPILFAATGIALLAGFRPWTWDDRGEGATDSTTDFLRRFWFAVTLVGGAGITGAVLATSLHAFVEGRREASRLGPLVGSPPRSATIRVTPHASGEGAGLCLALAF